MCGINTSYTQLLALMSHITSMISLSMSAMGETTLLEKGRDSIVVLMQAQLN
jgi:membrane protein YqaA with SNARE-associated domain